MSTLEKVNERLDKLAGAFDGIKQALEQPQYPRRGESQSYWQPGDEPLERSTGSRGQKSTPRLSRDYQPFRVWKSAGDFYRDLIATHGTGAFRERLSKASQGLFKSVQGMNEGVGADGGFAVLPEMSPNIMDRVQANSLFAETDNYPVAGNHMTFLRNAETSRAAVLGTAACRPTGWAKGPPAPRASRNWPNCR